MATITEQISSLNLNILSNEQFNGIADKGTNEFYLIKDYILPISEGGTGATDAVSARSNLEVYSASETDMAIAQAIPTEIKNPASLTVGDKVYDGSKAIEVVASDLNIPTNLANGSTTGSLRTVGSIEEDASYSLGQYSFAQGLGTMASAYTAHAEGDSTQALADSSHAEGYSTVANGVSSHAEGDGTTASAHASHAEGDGTKATGDASHAEGAGTKAAGDNSHAEGYQTTASGNGSHSEGYGSSASGDYSHSEGINTQVYAYGAHAEGLNTLIRDTAAYGHGEGSDNQVSGLVSHAEGYHTATTGAYSHAEGSSVIAWGENSHAEGGGTSSIVQADSTATLLVIDAGTFAVGDTLYFSIGDSSMAYACVVEEIIESGKQYTISGLSDAPVPDSRVYKYGAAVGKSSHAEGYNTIAQGDYSHSEGIRSTASGRGAHATGSRTTASGVYSHSEGDRTTAAGLASHAEGYGTTAAGNYSHVQGKYNISDTDNTYAHIVGNGTSTAYSNAHTLDWEGNAWYAGSVSAQSIHLGGAILNYDTDKDAIVISFI